MKKIEIGGYIPPKFRDVPVRVFLNGDTDQLTVELGGDTTLVEHEDECSCDYCRGLCSVFYKPQSPA